MHTKYRLEERYSDSTLTNQLVVRYTSWNRSETLWRSLPCSGLCLRTMFGNKISAKQLHKRGACIWLCIPLPCTPFNAPS